jgi:hypothetical protein
MTAPPLRPFSVRIFVPDGNAAGLRLVEKSHWTGFGLVFPRAVFPTIRDRRELGRAGVYILLGPSEADGLPTVYIGQGDPVRLRLGHHHANRDGWTWAIAFTSKDRWLNSAHAQYVEARLVRRAREARRARLDNQAMPREPALAEAERVDAEGFMMDMLSVLPLLGLTVFELAPPAQAGEETLLLRSQRVTARGRDATGGFTVHAGSTASPTVAPSASSGVRALRDELVAQGVLAVQGEQLIFAEDYVFASPSTAAAVVLGREANGRTEWVDAMGRTLRQIQEGQSEG